MNVFKHIKLVRKEMTWEDAKKGIETENMLIFEKTESNPAYASVETRWDMANALKLSGEVLQLNKQRKYLN
jgi:hypothetical protein